MPDYISTGNDWYSITPTQTEQAKTAKSTVITAATAATHRKKKD